MSDWPLIVRLRTRSLRWRRKRVERRFGRLFHETSALFFKHDPIGINFEDNTEEYDAEAGTVLPRLSGCASAVDVRRVVFEEFRRWFGSETAGDEIRYAPIAEELWALWLKHQLSRSSGWKRFQVAGNEFVTELVLRAFVLDAEPPAEFLGVEPFDVASEPAGLDRRSRAGTWLKTGENKRIHAECAFASE